MYKIHKQTELEKGEIRGLPRNGEWVVILFNLIESNGYTLLCKSPYRVLFRVILRKLSSKSKHLIARA